MVGASVICIECGFDKRKGRRLETIHQPVAEEENDVPPAPRVRSTRKRPVSGLGGLVCIGGGLGLLIASLYVMPVLIMGPMLEMQQGRKVPWGEAVSWPFVAFSAMVLILGLVMRARPR
jgi:hypothetical protein